MELATIEVDQDEAKAKLAEYRQVLDGERSEEDKAIEQAYRAVARGLTVINLPAAVHAGGYFPSGLPRIAVVRADATECYVERAWTGNGDWRTFLFSVDGEPRRSRGALVGRNTVRVTVDGPITDQPKVWRGRTTVPLVPPKYRPRRGRLSSCHLLWEVEAWDPTPPVDPALIRHLRGDLWTVLAVWDLTDLERAVLAQRVNRR